MVSPALEEDRKERLHYLEQMRGALLIDLPETAKVMGQASAALAERMKKHDYRPEDRILWGSQENAEITASLMEIRNTAGPKSFNPLLQLAKKLYIPNPLKV